MTEEFGRGVYANQPIHSGEWIETAEILLLSEDDTFRVNSTALKDYTFVVEEDIKYEYINNQDCLVLGNGELYNHSNEPNASYELVHLNGRKQMVFKALREIEHNEQIFIDYNADTNRKVIVGEDKYTTNLV
jgi:hypothetical protein